MFLIREIRGYNILLPILYVKFVTPAREKYGDGYEDVDVFFHLGKFFRFPLYKWNLSAHKENRFHGI